MSYARPFRPVADHRTCSKAPESTRRNRIVGIPLGGGVRKELGHKFSSIAPQLRFDVVSVELPSAAATDVLIARIPLSALRPHIIENLFYRRGDGGSAEKMSYYEVRDQFRLTQERLQRVTLLRLELAMYQQMTGMIASNMSVGNRPITSLHRFDTSAFKTLVANTIGALPADPAIMRLLLMVPIHTAELNNTLDRAQNPAWIDRLMNSTMHQRTAALIVGGHEILNAGGQGAERWRP